MDNNEAKKNTIPVLVWDGKTEVPRTVQVPATNDIPREVWETFNKIFLKRLAQGWFKPLDPADAYHYVAEKLLKKTESEKYKTSTDKTAYLIATMYSSFLEFGARHVVSARLNAKRLTNWQNKMTKKFRLSDDEMDVETLLEMMPYVPRPSDANAESRRILREILPYLPGEVCRAFHAYIAADGNLYATAARLNMPRRTFCRKWPKYLAIARKIVQEVR